MKLASQYHLLFLAITLPLLSAAQDTTQTAEDRADFLKFVIPEILNGAKIDPAPKTNLAAQFGDDRFTLKTGVQLDGGSEGNYKFTLTASPYLAASDDKSTLYSKGEGIQDYGVAIGLNYLRRTRYVAEKGDDVVISRRVRWLAARYFHDHQSFTLFDTSASFQAMQQDRSLGLGQFYVSYNHFFRSTNGCYRLLNAIWSVGAGYASFTNYKQLAERELIEGTIIYNTDSTAYRTIAENTEGRAGELKVRSGLAIYGEVYKDLIRLPNDGSIRLGLRGTWFAPGTDDENSITSGGFFITTKKKGDDGKNEDSANFSITVRMDQFQKSHEAEYFENYAKVLVGVALPLGF